MTLAQFNFVWGLLLVTWYRHPHCFVLGCGRDTLSAWVRHATGFWVHPTTLRRALLAAVALGWVRMDRAPPRYTRFHFNEKD